MLKRGMEIDWMLNKNLDTIEEKIYEYAMNGIKNSSYLIKLHYNVQKLAT